VPAIALDAVLAFGAGLLLALNVAPLLRLLARGRRLERHVQEAARIAFYDLGISRTSGRSGLLVFVSTFEQRAVLLPDVGVPVEAFGGAWHGAAAALSRAVKARDFAAFGRALESLGPMLSQQLPRSADDVNELSDEVQ
jgi:putative membrane protein